MILVRYTTKELLTLPCDIREVGTTVNETNFKFLEPRLNKAQIFEFIDSNIEAVEKYEFEPNITVNSEGIASYSLNEIQQNIINYDWHLPESFQREVGRIENHNPCEYYWIRLIFNEETCTNDSNDIDKFFKRVVGRRKAPYLANKNGESIYYLYLSYLLVSDGFGVDGNGTITLPSLLTGTPFEQLGEAEIIDGKIYLRQNG